MGIISTKLRNSAAGQTCTFQIPGVCSHNAETTVLCHAPSEVSGMGSKGHDFHAAFGCHTCHEALDQRRLGKVERLFYWLRGMMRTQAIWIERGLVIIPVDPATAKRRPKKKGNWPTSDKPWPKRKLESRNDLARPRAALQQENNHE